MKLCRSLFLTCSSSFALACLANSIAYAQTNGTWTGADGATWNTSNTSWSGVSGTPWDSTNGTTANATFNATSGSASVSGTVFANSITYSPVAGNFSIANGNITLAGTTPTINNYNPTGTLTLSSTVAGSAGLVSRGAGTLALSGNNTYTGTTTVRGGQLILDYSGLSNTADPLSTGAVTLDMGTLTLKGKSSGSTTETISTLNMGANLGTANTLKLDSNGGSGIALTASTFGMATTAGNTQNINLIDLSSSASNSITVGALGASAKVFNDVLMQTGDGGTSGRANLVVRDSSGYGFATLSNTTNGTIGRLSTGTALTGNNSSIGSNFRLTTSGTLTRTADLSFSTITLDSTAGAVTLDMGAGNFTASGSGRGILVTGSNDVSITGTGRVLGAGAAWFHNYSTGTFTFGLSTSNTASSLMFGGSGLTVWTGNSTKASTADNLYIEGGIFRPTADQNWAVSSSSGTGVGRGEVFISSGAVLEVGADLNGATAGDLTNAVGGTSTNGAIGNIRFWGNSGVSAFGGDRIVGFRASGSLQSLTWGSSSFLTDAGGTGDGNYVFKLSSDKSDSTVTVQNAIALGSLNRTVEVANGSAATDAILSGALSGTGGLVKSGAGALTLSGANSYTGATSINAGTLSTSAADRISNSSAVTVASGASFLLGGSETVGSIAGAGNYSIAGFTLTAGGDNTSTTVSGNITGASGALTKSGSGNLALSGTSANTYNGTTTVNAGTLTLDKTSGVVAVGGDLALNGSSKLLYGTAKNDQIANLASVTINGSQSVFNGSVWGSATLGTIQSNITETIGSLTVTDGQFNTGIGGNWTVTGAGVFDGSTGDTRFLGFSSSRISFNSLSLTAMTGTTITTDPDSFAMGGNQATVSTLVVGSGGLTLNGSTLGLNKGASSGNAGSRLILNGNITTTGSSASFIASNAGTFGISDILLSSTAGSVTRTITTGSGADLTISVPITNGSATTAGIIKDGLGTLTITGNNTYTGTTTVSQGTLAVNGNLASSVTVSANTTLQGSGTLGALTVSGQLAPGNSIESLGVSSASFLSGSTYAYELNSNVLGGDLLYTTGAINIATGTTLTLTELASGTLAMNSKLTLISYGSWNDGLFTYNGSTLANNSKFFLGTNEWLFRYDDTEGGSNYLSDQAGASGYITMTVVPEPNVAMLAGSLLLMTLLRRRRD
jgi:fibronectin-binding autotransporter adhesin